MSRLLFEGAGLLVTHIAARDRVRLSFITSDPRDGATLDAAHVIVLADVLRSWSDPFIINKPDIDPLLQKALDTLHSIGGAFLARRMLLGTHNEPPRKLTEPLRESMQAKALTDEAIENLALDTWEEIVTAIHEARHE
jgi:hypothetical protein